MKRNRALDGLRGLAAAIVVISHFSKHVGLERLLGRGTGEVGVMLFFVLSGFLMGQLYLGVKPTVAAVLSFYRRRVARVVPLYLIVVGLCFVSFQTWNEASLLPWVTPENLWEHLLFWQGAGHLWTLPVEVQFYLVFPLLWLAFARMPSATLPGVMLLIAALDLLGFPPSAPLLRRAAFFLAGVAASQFRWAETAGASFVFACAIVLYVLMLPPIRSTLDMHLLLGGAPWHTESWQSWCYLFTATVIVMSGAAAPLARTLLGSLPLRYLGMVSYSLYLLHPPVIRLMVRIDAVRDSPLALTGLVTLALLLVSSLSYYLVEAPLRRLINGRDWSAQPL
jgi:peptidoglycan/LPS O-acetylase OafA/YrhL